jgi:HAD superfamily hydrolase (TIGR01509 family)
VPEQVRAAVRSAAARVPLAICSGAARAEIEPVLAAAGLSSCFRAVVSADDVVAGKPDPEGYERALALLAAEPAEAVVFEDTAAGVASARAAGVGTVLAMKTTLDPHRLADADRLIDRLDVDAVRSCLS